jgi:hypothetical protein
MEPQSFLPSHHRSYAEFVRNTKKQTQHNTQQGVQGSGVLKMGAIEIKNLQHDHAYTGREQTHKK